MDDGLIVGESSKCPCFTASAGLARGLQLRRPLHQRRTACCGRQACLGPLCTSAHVLDPWRLPRAHRQGWFIRGPAGSQGAHAGAAPRKTRGIARRIRRTNEHRNRRTLARGVSELV